MILGNPVGLWQGGKELEKEAPGVDESSVFYSIGYIEVGGNTEFLVNTSNSVETITASDVHAANMEIVLSGIHLEIASSDFHVV